MPIASDNTRRTIEFLYEYETPGGTVLQYHMKFQHTEAGPTITVQMLPYEAVELPADMFAEVSQFLAAEGAVRNANLPVIGRGNPASAAVLQLPQIGSRKMAVNQPAPTAGSQARANQIAMSALPQDGQPEGASSVPQVSDDEAEEMRQERLKAAAEAKKAKKPFHSAHTHKKG